MAGVLAGGGACDPVIEAAADLQQRVAGLVDAPWPIGWLVAGLLLLAAVLAVLAVRKRSRRASRSTSPLDRAST